MALGVGTSTLMIKDMEPTACRVVEAMARHAAAPPLTRDVTLESEDHRDASALELLRRDVLLTSRDDTLTPTTVTLRLPVDAMFPADDEDSCMMSNDCSWVSETHRNATVVAVVQEGPLWAPLRFPRVPLSDVHIVASLLLPPTRKPTLHDDDIPTPLPITVTLADAVAAVFSPMWLLITLLSYVETVCKLVS